MNINTKIAKISIILGVLIICSIVVDFMVNTQSVKDVSAKESILIGLNLLYGLLLLIGGFTYSFYHNWPKILLYCLYWVLLFCILCIGSSFVFQLFLSKVNIFELTLVVSVATVITIIFIVFLSKILKGLHLQMFEGRNIHKNK